MEIRNMKLHEENKPCSVQDYKGREKAHRDARIENIEELGLNEICCSEAEGTPRIRNG